MEEMLFIDSCSNSGFDLELCESSTNGRIKFRGKFQEAGAVNKNKRMYPYEVLDENLKRLTEAMKSRRLLGELDHPQDSIIHFADASHLITNLWWEGNVLMGEGEVLNTPNGRVLRALIEDGVQVGMSSRGIGNGATNEEGILVIGESYKLITFDAVADPSTFAAFQKKIITPRKTRNEEFVDASSRNVIENQPDSNNSNIKNEESSIDNNNVTKAALIACLGGIVKTHTESIKSELI